MKNQSNTRRQFIRSSVFGLLAVPAYGIASNAFTSSTATYNVSTDNLYYRYPSLDDDRVSAVVGAAHGNFDKVKELVSSRSELANATWDWGFGDWETAIGAASHMGRRDIAKFLLDHGARPDIFTFAMMGDLNSVKAMVESTPGVQSIPGPHGITLLQHARNGLRYKSLSEEETTQLNAMVTFLESLGNADVKAKSLPISEEEQKVYLGEYRFGEGEDEILVVSLNRGKNLQIARKGTFGRVLNRVDNHIFAPGGAPSVQVTFDVNGGKANSLTVHEPEPLVLAMRIS